MKELVDKISAEAGITDRQAQRALEVVMAEVRSKMPPKMADKLERVLAGQDFYGGSWFATLKNRRRLRGSS